MPDTLLEDINKRIKYYQTLDVARHRLRVLKGLIDDPEELNDFERRYKKLMEYN